MELGDQGAWTLKMVLYQCTGRKVASARTLPKSDQVLCVKRKHLSAEMDEQVCQYTFQFGLSGHYLFSDFQIDLYTILIHHVASYYLHAATYTVKLYTVRL